MRPRIIADSRLETNAVARWKVKSPPRPGLTAPITVAYKYESDSGEKVQRRALRPSDFQNGEAAYTVDAPGLRRCRSVAISY